MIDTKLTWKDAIRTAKERIAIGSTHVHLFDAAIEDLDWSKCTSVKPGGSHRLDMDTSVTFEFKDAGLTISWYLDVEKREANGKGIYQIDTEAVATVMARLKGKPRADFTAYLKRSAEAVRKRGAELLAAATSQFGEAAILEHLSDSGD